MKVSTRLIKFVQGFELLRLSAYDDGVGVWTIGWGHTGVDIVPGTTITEAQALKYFNGDMAVVETAVGMNVDVPLSQSQFDALCSFVFNVGSGAFRSSTLLRKLNAGDYDAVPFEMNRWIHGGAPGAKRVLRGLVKRRAQEAEMFAVEHLPKTAPRETISPTPVRRERGRLSSSRTIRGGGLAGGGIATAGSAMAIDRVDALSGQVSWLPSVLAGVVVVALVAALIGVAVVMYARRDDFLRARF